jgi:Cys-tRNA synthase (O-phospho-L-seryl-tRNA:Cys-tRNA synthase)
MSHYDCVVAAERHGWRVALGATDYGLFQTLDEAFKIAMEAVKNSHSRVLVAVRTPTRELVLMD